MLDESEVRLGVAGGLLVVVLCAVCWTGVPDRDGIELTATALLSLTVTRWGGVLLGVTCWALLTGFVTHHDGRLTFAPHDLVLLAAALAVSVSAAQLSATGPRGRRSEEGLGCGVERGRLDRPM